MPNYNITLDDIKSVDYERYKSIFQHSEFFDVPGREHYRLLAYISTLFDNVNIIDIGTKAVTQLGFLADTSQDPTHYEVLSKMIKDLSDTSEKLLKTHESYERILNKRNTKKDTKIAEGEGVSVYLSTSEIARAIKDLGK